MFVINHEYSAWIQILNMTSRLGTYKYISSVKNHKLWDTRCMFYIKPKLTSSRFIASVFGTVPRSVQRTIKIASQWGKSEWCGHTIEILIAKDSRYI